MGIAQAGLDESHVLYSAQGGLGALPPAASHVPSPLLDLLVEVHDTRPGRRRLAGAAGMSLCAICPTTQRS